MVILKDLFCNSTLTLGWFHITLCTFRGSFANLRGVLLTTGTFGKVFLAQRLADENGDAEVGVVLKTSREKLARF